jgi:hypothetical protein
MSILVSSSSPDDDISRPLFSKGVGRSVFFSHLCRTTIEEEIQCLFNRSNADIFALPSSFVQISFRFSRFFHLDPLSLSGQKLLRKADFHLGSYVTKMQRIGHLSLPNTMMMIDNEESDRDSMTPTADTRRRRHLVILSLTNGSIGYLTPIDEEMYRRLRVLHSKMTLFLQHLCGLNPKAFRTYQSTDRPLTNLAHNIIDGQLVYQFLDLSIGQQHDFSRQVGMSAERIQHDLIQLSCRYEFL